MTLIVSGVDSRVNITQTTYHCTTPANTNTSASNRDGDPRSKGDDEKAPRTSAEPDAEMLDIEPSVSSPNPPSFLSQLKVYNGTFSRESIWKIFLRPLPFMLSPVVRTTIAYSQCSEAYDNDKLTAERVIDMVHISQHVDAICVAEYVSTFSVSFFTGYGVDAPVGLVVLCSSTIFIVTYDFTPVQIVRHSVSHVSMSHAHFCRCMLPPRV